MISVNTTNKNPTHFLRAVELIERGRKLFGVPSENWPAPTRYKFGVPNDYYYSELWIDGMDWQPTYWAIEQFSYEDPIINPLLIFSNHTKRELFNEYDFEQMVMAMFHFRRDKFVLKLNDSTIYNDMVWPFLKLIDAEPRCGLIPVKFSHASQNAVEFWVNHAFIPDEYLERGVEDENNRDNWYTPTGFNRGIQKGQSEV